MLTSILGAQLSWHFASGWVFEPAIVGPDSVEYSLKEGPHAGRHAVQRFCYQRVVPGVETTAWYEESGAVVHMTWYLQTLFLADTTTMTDADHRLLALDLYAEPGRTFQLPPPLVCRRLRQPGHREHGLRRVRRRHGRVRHVPRLR